jgi:hypothetical protein
MENASKSALHGAHAPLVYSKRIVSGQEKEPHTCGA